MKFQSKKYKINITKEKFLDTIKDKFRLPAEDILIGPFTNKTCEWVTGKIENNSFALSDYRFPKFGINISGQIEEDINGIEVSTFINFKARIIIAQSFFIFWFLLIFFLSNYVYARFSLLLMLLIGEIGNYFLISSIIKGFFRFFENLFKNKNLEVID